MVEQKVDSKSGSRFEEFGKKVDDRVSQAMPRIEEEVKKVIAYLNDQVVPQVRQESSQALNIAADRLKKLAEQLENRRGAK